MLIPDNDHYYIDEDAQWWYTPDPVYGTPRQRVYSQTCQLCSQEFINRHKQQFCSKECTGISQRGIRRESRVCEWCGKEFIPQRTYSKTCSIRCAYDLGNTKRGSPGEKNGNWKGGISNHSGGYVTEWVAGRGEVLQHRLRMEETIGRQLYDYEQVHHKNGVRDDNRPENLELWIIRQPPGQRAVDMVDFAIEILKTYGNLVYEGKIE